jgi:hypothetical protein
MIHLSLELRAIQAAPASSNVNGYLAPSYVLTIDHRGARHCPAHAIVSHA